MSDLSHIFDGAVSEPDYEPEPKSKRKIFSPKTKSGPVHQLSREEYLARKAELEAQYNLPLGNNNLPRELNPACYIPLYIF